MRYKSMLALLLIFFILSPLHADTAKLFVKCNVKAEVKVNGKEVGRTGKLIKGVPSGNVTITVSAEGYTDHTENVTLKAGEINKREVTLKKSPKANLLVKCNVKADIFINDVKIGKTGKTLSDLPAGKARIRVYAKGYRDFEKEISLVKGKTVTLEVTLEEPRALVDIITDPPGARVIIDKVEEADVTPLTVSVKPGPHNLTIVLKGYKDIVMKKEEFTDGKTIEKKLEPGKSRWRQPRKHFKKPKAVKLRTDFTTGVLPGWLEVKNVEGSTWKIRNGKGILEQPKNESMGALLVKKRFDIAKPFRLRVCMKYPDHGGTFQPFKAIYIQAGDEVFTTERGNKAKPIHYGWGIGVNGSLYAHMNAPGRNAESIVSGNPPKSVCHDAAALRAGGDAYYLKNRKGTYIWELVSKNGRLMYHLYDASGNPLLSHGPVLLAPSTRHNAGPFRILIGDVFTERTRGKAEFDWLEFEFPKGM